MTESSRHETPHISIVVSTYNRCEQLRHALAALLEQSTVDLICELIVVDNNSTDATRSVIESFLQSGGTHLQHLFEPRQGLSYGRNTGIARARAPLIAFTDDDVRPARDWAVRIKRCFDEHPEVDFIGGKVLPRWRVQPPAWLTPDHWSPLALVDYGDQLFVVDPQRPFCLVGANLAFRREVFDRLGTFSPDLQRVKDGIGSAEDYDMHLRVWNAGGKGLYAPDVVVTSDVEPDRVTKSYHRKWYAGHGGFSARMRLKEVMSSPEGCLIPECTEASRLFGVPGFVYVELFGSLARWAQAALRRQESGAFYHENRVRHGVYYICECYRQNRTESGHSTVAEVARFIRTVVRKRLKAHAVKSQPAA
jgi:glycosyltransferase involved in cell wall biosynthesis